LFQTNFFTDLTHVILGNNITEIGHNAFYNCSSLLKIDILNSVTKIEDYAFVGCEKLLTIKLIAVEEIGIEAFARCTSLNSIFLGNNSDHYEGLKLISENAFLDCTALEIVKIYKVFRIDTVSNTNYNETAFAGCTNLKIVVSYSDYLFFKEVYKGKSILPLSDVSIDIEFIKLTTDTIPDMFELIKKLLNDVHELSERVSVLTDKPQQNPSVLTDKPQQNLSVLTYTQQQTQIIEKNMEEAYIYLLGEVKSFRTPQSN
jgi:hypothetical protein